MLDLLDIHYYGGKIKEVLQFLKKPELSFERIKTTEKLKAVIALLFITLAFSLIIGIFISKFDTGQHKVIDFIDQQPFYIILLLGGVVAPVLEEMIFRLVMYFKPAYLFIFSLFVFMFLTGRYLLERNLWWMGIVAVILSLLILLFSNRYKKEIVIFWGGNFKWIFYFSCILFGFIHITNYDITVKTILLLPMLTLPQLIAGIILGFIRVKYGFFYNCLMHSLFNTLLLAIALVGK